MSVQFWPDGAVKTYDMKCAGGCGFSGGYSGFCSKCWKALDSAKQEEASKREAELEVGRAQIREEKEAADAEKRRVAAEASRKREREEPEQEAERQEKLSRVMARRKAENDCELVQQGTPEVWSCGVGGHRSPGVSVDEEPRHVHSDPAATAALRQACVEVSAALEGVEEGSSESGAPYVGFCVSVKDNPNLAAFHGQSPRTILAELFGEDDCSQLNWTTDLNVTAAQLFPRYEEYGEDEGGDGDEEGDENATKIRALNNAAAAIARVAAPGTGFTSYPDGNADVFVGDIFLGAVTPNGDIIGAMCNLVRT